MLSTFLQYYGTIYHAIILLYLTFIYVHFVNLQTSSVYYKIKNTILSTSFTWYAKVHSYIKKLFESVNEPEIKYFGRFVAIKTNTNDYVTSCLVIKGLYNCTVTLDDKPTKYLCYVGNDAIKKGFPSKRNTYIVGLPFDLHTVENKKVVIIMKSLITEKEESYTFHDNIPSEIVPNF